MTTLVRRPQAIPHLKPHRRYVEPWEEEWKGSVLFEWLMPRGEVNSSSKIVYARLARYARKGEAWPRHSTLAKECGMGVRTVQRALNELEQHGLIEVRTRIGSSNLYRFPHHDWMDTSAKVAEQAGQDDRPTYATTTGEAGLTGRQKSVSRSHSVEVKKEESRSRAYVPVERPRKDPDDASPAGGSARSPRRPSRAELLADLFFATAVKAGLDRNGPLRGKQALRVHFAGLRRAGVSRERCEEMIEEFVVSHDRYTRPGVRLVGAFIRAQEPILETLQSRVTRSDYDPSESSPRRPR